MARRFTATTDVVYFNDNTNLPQPTVYTAGWLVKGATLDATARQMLHHGSTQLSTKGNSTGDFRCIREYTGVSSVHSITVANHGCIWNDGAWHSVIVSHNGAAAGSAGNNDWSLWIDGVQKTGFVMDTAPTLLLGTGAWYCRTGNNNNDGSQNSPLGGETARIWIANRAPTADEVLYFHSTGAPPMQVPELKMYCALDGNGTSEPATLGPTATMTVTGALGTVGPAFAPSPTLFRHGRRPPRVRKYPALHPGPATMPHRTVGRVVPSSDSNIVEVLTSVGLLTLQTSTLNSTVALDTPVGFLTLQTSTLNSASTVATPVGFLTLDAGTPTLNLSSSTTAGLLTLQTSTLNSASALTPVGFLTLGAATPSLTLGTPISLAGQLLLGASTLNQLSLLSSTGLLTLDAAAPTLTLSSALTPTGTLTLNAATPTLNLSSAVTTPGTLTLGAAATTGSVTGLATPTELVLGSVTVTPSGGGGGGSQPPNPWPWYLFTYPRR